ncbi:MAG: tetratricopeptide repeat protein [Acidobacteriia bacterium]|nr:tetratricopeptide repeat protein [Terriglobia bacterium]
MSKQSWIPPILLIFLLGILLPSSAMAQRDSPQEKPPAEKKPAAKKPVTKKPAAGEYPDNEELQKEMEKAKQASSEIEQMMKQMGLDEKTKKAKEVMKHAGPGDLDTSAIPRKDAARIAKLRKSILTDAELKPFLQQTSAAVEQRLSPKSRKFAEEVSQKLRTRYPGAAGLAAAASGLWMKGALGPALYLMGRASLEDPANPDHLNNYAAFLTMAGKEEAALPLLQKLNQKYPQNSTVLNNMGQAWFGLGDLPEAEKYLNAAIKVFGYHSQANFTMCLIEESKGNKQAAVSAMKRSIRSAFSNEKVNKLRQLGSPVDKDDIAWNFHMPQDPLALHLYQVPAYSHSVEESDALAPRWESFKDGVRNLIRQLEAEKRAHEAPAEQNRNQMLQKAMAMAQAGGNPIPLVLPPFAPKATLAMKAFDEQMEIQEKLRAESAKQERAKIGEFKRAHLAALNAIYQKYNREGGEGDEVDDDEAMCADYNAENSRFLQTANTINEKIQNEQMHNLMRKINEDTYFVQYMVSSKDAFEAAKADAKRTYLNSLLSLAHAEAGKCIPRKSRDNKKPSPDKLQSYDDMHCDTRIQLNMFLVNAEFDCNTSKLEYDAIFVQGTHVEDLNTGKIISGSVEIMLSAGIGKGLEAGPVKIEAKAGVGAFIEYGDTGVTDFGPLVMAKAEAGVNFREGTDPTEVHVGHGESVNVGDLPFSVEAGVEGRWGWNSSASLAGKGILSGMGGHGE